MRASAISTRWRNGRATARRDRLLYAGNNLDKARDIFAQAIKHRPGMTIRQRTRVLATVLDLKLIKADNGRGGKSSLSRQNSSLLSG
jgi:hypothetical protein